MAGDERGDMKRAGLKQYTKRRGKTGSEKLRSAANTLLRHEGRLMVEDLAEDCGEGQLESARLLYEIVHSAEGHDETMRGRSFRSLALDPDEE
jgi:hypothetical protein